MDITKGKTITGFLWRFAERCGAQSVSFVVSIILARLLSPQTYGVVALITIFTTVLQVFVDSGMGNALIQKKDADDLDFSSVFYFNMAMCVFLYCVMFFAAPFLAAFYKNNDLVWLIRVISLTLVISGLKNVQQAYVSKKMIFKRFFFATIIGTICSAVIGIVMAYNGFGVWALVAQQLSNAAIDTFILWLSVKWRPKMMFSINRLKNLIGYGGKLLISALIDTVYNNVRSLIIGKMYTPSDLAFYNKGRQFPYLVITNINTSIDSVLFPTMSTVQDDTDRIKNMTRQAIKVSTYFIAPIMMGLAFCADDFIKLLLTEKWLPCVAYMRIFCITFMFYPIHTANLNAIKAMGRSDIFLKLEVMKKIVGISALAISMWFGVMAMAYSLLVTSVLGQIINSHPNRKLLNYGYIDQLKDIFPAILTAVFMGVCVYFVKYMCFSSLITLIIQVGLGGAIYIGISAVFGFASFKYIIATLKGFKKKK